MKNITFKKSSLLFRIASIYGSLPYCAKMYGCSICEYNKHILVGLCNIIFGIVAISISLSIMLSPTFYGVLYLLHPEVGFVWNDIVIGGLIIDVIALITGICIYVTDSPTWEAIQERRTLNYEPSKLLLQWRAFHDNICFKVDFK